MADGYREVQRLHPAIRVLVAASCVLAAWVPLGMALFWGGGRGAPTALVLGLLFAVIGVALPAVLCLVMRLEVYVGKDALYVRFIPLRSRRIPYEKIVRCEPCAYRPILQYGGWGIRWGGPKNWAYTMRGNRGVRLYLEGGQRLLIGSQAPEELARAIEDRGIRLP